MEYEQVDDGRPTYLREPLPEIDIEDYVEFQEKSFWFKDRGCFRGR